jgi:hypothetical protein
LPLLPVLINLSISITPVCLDTEPTHSLPNTAEH